MKAAVREIGWCWYAIFSLSRDDGLTVHMGCRFIWCVSVREPSSTRFQETAPEPSVGALYTVAQPS